MNLHSTVHSVTDAAPPRAHSAARRPRPADDALLTIDRACGGPLSLIDDGPLRIHAEPGLVIRVHAGCLWLPDPVQQASLAVTAGQSFALDRHGVVLAMASRRTQIEPVWPAVRVAAAWH